MAKILVVEDDLEVMDVISQILVLDGHETEVCQNGRMALAKLAESGYDLIITDLLMPEVDGLEFLLELKRQQSSVPVIAVSGGLGSRGTDFLEHAKMLGAGATLGKPFRASELLALVNEQLN